MSGNYHQFQKQMDNSEGLIEKIALQFSSYFKLESSEHIWIPHLPKRKAKIYFVWNFAEQPKLKILLEETLIPR